jgi:hypothetical protein
MNQGLRDELVAMARHDEAVRAQSLPLCRPTEGRVGLGLAERSKRDVGSRVGGERRPARGSAIHGLGREREAGAGLTDWLQHIVIVDVLVVAIGFVLRAVGGAVAIDVEISGWLLICTILLALFLALGKRRHEYLALGGEAATHRPILAEYSAGLLDQMIAVVTASTVTAYALYTMSPETVAKFHTHLLPATLPFVLYGIFRYLYLLYSKQLGGNPSELFLNDGPLLVNTFLWFVMVLVIIFS